MSYSVLQPKGHFGPTNETTWTCGLKTCVEWLKVKAWWQAHTRDGASRGGALLFGKCHILPLSSLVFAIRKTTKVVYSKNSSSDLITAYKMFALETPHWGFCNLVALQMLSHGQFRISLCLDLDCVPGVCSLSGIQAGKSVCCGRSATERCSCSACMVGRSAQHFTSCASGSDQRQQVSLHLSASMQI